MTDNEITKSFDNLINSMDELLPVLDQQGSKLVEKHHYQEARETISKAEMVMSLQNKLNALKDDWLGLGLATDEPSPADKEASKKVSPETEKQFRSQSHTSSKEFRIPILQALVNLGGSAKRKLVFDELEKIMGDQLSENDWKPLPSRKRVSRWQRIATNTRTNLREDGYITVDANQGIWIITEKGKAFLNNYDGNEG